jgi:hypothetical protein
MFSLKFSGNNSAGFIDTAARPVENGAITATVSAGTQLLLLRIPAIVTTDSERSRPPVPIDRDQGGAGIGGAVG